MNSSPCLSSMFAIVMPITRVANDYRMNILSEARHAVVGNQRD